MLVLTISCASLWAQNYSIRVEVSGTVDKEAWVEVESRNFRVLGNAGLKQLRRIAVDLEEIRRHFLKAFPKQAISSVHATVIVFRNDKSLRLFMEGVGAGAVYNGVDRNYIVLNAGEKRRRSVYHDYVRTLMDDQVLPLWLREGLAEYYGSIESERYAFGEGRTLQIGYPIRSHEKLLQDRSFLPIDQLFGMTEKSAAFDESSSQGIFLAESWALVHMLHNHGSEDSVKRLVESLLNGNPVRQSFNAVYGIEPALLEMGLKDYIHTSKKSGWTYTRIPYCLCDSSPNDWLQFNFDRTLSYIKDLGQRELTGAEIRFYIGDLLLHRGSVQQAEAYLQDALRLNSELAAAHASLGALRIRQESYDEARKHIERALALGTDNPLPYLFYARLIWRETPALEELTKEQLESMQTALSRAIRFGPNLHEATDMLTEIDFISRSRGFAVSGETRTMPENREDSLPSPVLRQNPVEDVIY